MKPEPDWMTALREEQGRTSQRLVSARLGLSQTTISQVLNGSYRGNLKRIEERVRGELMNKRIECPVLGAISPRRCQDEQKRPFAATNPQRVELWKACRGGCRHSTIGKKP